LISPLPRWLTGPYLTLVGTYGYLPFTTGEAKNLLKDNAAPLLLSRLKRTGWVERLKRETYRIVHPILCISEISGNRWRNRVSQSERLPLLELAFARALEEFGGRLVSVLLFGSLARGEAGPESDIDLLVVTEGLPESYGKRLDLVRRVIEFDQMRKWREYLWKEKGIYTLLDVIPLTPGEAMITHPFYLDMAEHSVLIWDRDSFMERKIRDLKVSLDKLGASKVTLPSGRSYWSLAKGEKEARELTI